MHRIEEHKTVPQRPEALPQRVAGAKVGFVHNMATHYRIKVFEAFARMCDAEFYFYSDGGEWYWQKSHGVAPKTGFVHRTLRGFWWGRTRVTPGLLPALLFGGYNVFIKCVNGRFALPATFAAARLRRAPFILWTGIWCRLQTPFHRLLFPITRFIYQHSDAVVVYGEHVKRYLISEGVAEERIFLAPQAVDNSLYRRTPSAAEVEALRAKHNLPADRKIVLYLGRLEEIKGLPDLLQAFAQLDRTDDILVFGGSGSQEEKLRALAAERGVLDRVRFTGHVSQAEAPVLYGISWVTVLPSVTLPAGRELWGLVVNEAFNQGVPVIATDAVGAAAGGLVRNGRNGLIVPERDPSALRDAIETVLANPELRNRLGRAAARDVVSFTQEGMAAGLRDAVAYVMTAKTAKKEKVSRG